MPRTPAQTVSALPDFLTNATLGEMVAAELETLAVPPGITDAATHSVNGEEHHPPILSPVQAARASMLNRAAKAIRVFHESGDA